MNNAKLDRLNPIIGTEIRGIDLNQLDEAMAVWLRDLLADRQVLVIRDQSLDRAAQKSTPCIWLGCCRRTGWMWR